VDDAIGGRPTNPCVPKTNSDRKITTMAMDGCAVLLEYLIVLFSLSMNWMKFCCGLNGFSYPETRSFKFWRICKGEVKIAVPTRLWPVAQHRSVVPCVFYSSVDIKFFATERLGDVPLTRPKTWLMIHHVILVLVSLTITRSKRTLFLRITQGNKHSKLLYHRSWS
jgi:hypothetical protein